MLNLSAETFSRIIYQGLKEGERGFIPRKVWKEGKAHYLEGWLELNKILLGNWWWRNQLGPF